MNNRHASQIKTLLGLFSIDNRLLRLALGMRLDVQNRCALEHVQAFDAKATTLHRQNGKHGQPDGIGADGRTNAEHAFDFVRVTLFLSQVFGPEGFAAIEMEQDHDGLTGYDVHKPPGIFGQNLEFPLQIRDRAVPRHILGTMAHEADGCELDSHVRIFQLILAIYSPGVTWKTGVAICAGMSSQSCPQNRAWTA